nr:toll-like receptor 3 [Crassostrea gigas]
MTIAQISFFVLILVLGSVTTKQCGPSVKPPYGCRCMKYSKLYVTIRCKNQGDKTPFLTIPHMPNNTDQLIIEGFRFANLTKDIFKNLSSLSSLHRLSLRDNNIINISRDALSELKHLQGLEISYEIQVSKREISEMLSNISGNLSSLTFSHNAWDEPPKFFGLRDAPIQKLTLSHNYFRFLDGHWITDLTKLRKLDVSFNGITDIRHLSGLENITNLFLIGNWFKEFPKFCNFTLQKLTSLHFQYNKLTEFKPTYFQCLPNLQDLYLNGHAIRKLYNNTFSNLTSLRKLYIQRLAGQLFHIEPEAFKSNSLQKLIFTNNGFFFRNSSKEPSFEIFKYCPNLTVLNISSNNLELKENEFITMIKPLNTLKNLGIRTTGLAYLPRNLTRHLPMLRKLDASDNYLNGSWDGNSVFGNVPSLQYLDLSDNSIERITEYNFPLTLLNGIKDNGLDLSYNKLSCNCDDVLWFYNWMHANKKKLAHIGNITCRPNLPLHTSTRNLFYLTIKELCPMNPAVFIAIVSSGTALLVIFITLGTLYKLRWHIRHWLYVIKYKNKGYEIIPDDPDFKYDVFLVYADEDTKFIFDIVVPYLEGKGYSLCVRCRDFEIGKLYCDNIVDNMNLSRRILLILSNNFAKSKWCEFQMNFAYNRCLDEKINNIIVAVWEEISYKYLSNTLKVLLTSYDYALWSKSDATGRSLFWGKILRKLQFQSDDTECANGLLGVLQ